MAFSLIGTDGDVRVPATGTVPAALGNVFYLTNMSQAPVSGTLAVTQGGNTDNIDITLEPGEMQVYRSLLATTTLSFTGSVIHTAVKQGLPISHETDVQDQLRGSPRVADITSAEAFVTLQVLS